jgi:transcriptional regulator with XRE-family HTH domain
MTRNPPQPSIDELLDWIGTEEAKPSHEALSRWCERFPQHADALADYFATWAVQEEEPLVLSLDVERLANRAVSHALNLLHEERQHASAAPPLPTLSAAARARGMTDAELASRCGLDESMVVKLARRRIPLTSIPQLCLARLQEALALPIEKLRERLRGPPLAASGGARLKSKRKPILATETFSEALEASTLSEGEKEVWRAALADGASSAES